MKSSSYQRVTLLVNKLIVTMNLMATTNHSDNKTKLYLVVVLAWLSGLM